MGKMEPQPYANQTRVSQGGFCVQHTKLGYPGTIIPFSPFPLHVLKPHTGHQNLLGKETGVSQGRWESSWNGKDDHLPPNYCNFGAFQAKMWVKE